LDPKLATFSGHKDCVYALCLGPSDGEFFSAGADGAVVLWNVESPENGKMIVRLSSSVYAIFYFQNHNLLLIAANQDGFHLVDLESGKEIWNAATPGKNWFRINALNQNMVVAAGSAGSLVSIDVVSKTILHFQTPAVDNRALAVDLGTGKIALGNSGGDIGFIQNLGSETTILPKGHSNTVFGIALYPDGEHFVSCGRDAKLILWNKRFGLNWEIEKEIPAHLFGIHDVKIHPEKPILATCSMDKTLKIWDAENLKLLRVLDKTRDAGHGHSINQLLWMGKRELLLSCSDDRTISAWDIYR
jgi:WD40 repeat protein